VRRPVLPSTAAKALAFVTRGHCCTRRPTTPEEELLRDYFRAFGDANMGLLYAVMWDTAKPEDRDAIEWLIRDVLPDYSPKAARVALNFVDPLAAARARSRRRRHGG
jgi:hypothetical protein